MKKIFIIPVIGCMLALASCGGKNNSAEIAKENYRQSLNDSIVSLQAEIDSCNNQIAELSNEVNDWLRDFTTVNNPREASSYIIMTSAKDNYPLKSSGIIARLNDMGQFELIAALSSKPFDSIVVKSELETADSEVVPKDQALNYQTPELTTVTFTGDKADAIGKFVADNELNSMTVTYLQNGNPVQTVKVTENEAKIISYTYMLYKSNSEMERLERRVPLLHEKINLIRLHLEKE